MINLDKTLTLLNIDALKLKPQSVVKVFWICDSCGCEKLNIDIALSEII